MKLSMKHIVAAMFLCVLMGVVSAQPAADKSKLAAELSAALGIEEMFAAYLRACLASNAVYDPKEVFRTNPSYFGGVSPKSAYWPEVESVFRNYQKQICSYVTAADFSKFYADHFASALSKAELQSAIRFYSTAGGKKLRAVNLVANDDFQKYAQSKWGTLTKQSGAEADGEVSKIAQKYKRDPK
jgi:hypothetical protein